MRPYPKLYLFSASLALFFFLLFQVIPWMSFDFRIISTFGFFVLIGHGFLMLLQKKDQFEGYGVWFTFLGASIVKLILASIFWFVIVLQLKEYKLSFTFFFMAIYLFYTFFLLYLVKSVLRTR